MSRRCQILPWDSQLRNIKTFTLHLGVGTSTPSCVLLSLWSIYDVPRPFRYLLQVCFSSHSYGSKVFTHPGRRSLKPWQICMDLPFPDEILPNFVANTLSSWTLQNLAILYLLPLLYLIEENNTSSISPQCLKISYISFASKPYEYYVEKK